MTLRIVLATVHLLALGIGLGAVWARARALRGAVGAGEVRRALTADAWWGVAAALWLTTGLWRLLAGTEKATEYYLGNHAFLGKLGLFVVILLLEIRPMLTMARWRRAVARGELPGTDAARGISTISTIEAIIVVVMVAMAAVMARGLGSTNG